MRNNRFSKKGILTTAMLLTASAFATLGACAGDNNGATGYTVPADSTVEVGVKYTPDFALQGGVEARILDLTKAPKNSYARIKDGAFTPDVTGEYTYVVRFRQATESGVVEAEETITVKAVDTTAPVISGTIEDKTADIGVYSALADDLAAINVTDNCAQAVTLYAESVVFKGETTVLGEGVNSFRISEVGEYTVNVVAEDFSGNKSKASYKVTASDTSAPIIDVNGTAVAWANGGKVTLPAITVIDGSSYTVTATVKDASGAAVAVENNTITAGAGVYTVTYTVKDVANNESTKEIKLVVKENGTISDFAEKGEETLWANDGVRVADGKLKVYYPQGNNFELNYSNGFVVGDWSNYVSLSASVTNNRGAKLSVTPYLLVDGAWKETAAQSVAPNATADIKVYLADYDIEKVDGVKFALNCDGGVIVDFDDIKVSAAADDRVAPTGSTKYDISANGAAQVNVNATTKGVVKSTVYANVNCDVMMTLNYANGSVAATKSLKAGLNEITRYPDAEAGESVTSSNLENIVITNFEGYDITVYVSAITSEDISSIDMSAYAVTEGNYSVAYNETFAIPSPFTSSLRWYQDLTISLYKGTSRVKSGLSIGSLIPTVGTGSLKAGEYTIRYSFKDLAGASKTIDYTLTVEQNKLTANLVMPVLFYDAEGFDLPDPELTSAVFNKSQLAGATIEKYYRLAGRKTWNKVADGEKFTPVANKTYEIKYVIECEGEYRELNAEKFIHVDKYTIDFEAESACTEELAFWGMDSETGKYRKMKQRFLFDGGYYDYKDTLTANRFETTQDWSKSGTTSITSFSPAMRGWGGFVIRPVIANDKGFNAIQFWLKTEKDIPDLQIEIGAGAGENSPWNGNGWRVAEACPAKAGEHFYTVFLAEPIRPFESVGSFGATLTPGNRYYIDDLTFVYINRLSAEDSNTYEDQIDHTDGYELTKPSIASELLSAEELAKVSFVLTYSLNGKEEIEIKPNADGKYILKLAEGEYGEVVFKWTITTPNKWAADGGDLVRTFVSDKVLINCARLDIENAEVVLQDSDTTLALPTSQAGEISNPKVEYKPYGADEWIALEDGNLKLPTDKVGWFDLRYMADIAIGGGKSVTGFGLSQIYVRDKYVLVDFEGSDPFNGACDYMTNRGGGTLLSYEIVEDPENPGNHVEKLLNNMQAWEGIWYMNDKALVFDTPYNVLYMRVYSSTALSGYKIETYEGNTSKMVWAEYHIDLESGWNEVYIITQNPVTKFQGVQGKIGSGVPTIMFDDIALLRLELDGDIPTKGYYGEELTVPMGTMKGKEATVSYRLKGTEEWTAVENCKFTPAAVGTFEVRYAFEGITEIVKEISVELRVTGMDSLPASVKTGDTVTVPTVTAGSATAVASYRELGAEEWSALTDGKFVAAKEGSYEVRFYFEAIDVEMIKVVAATPANELLLTNFETPFDEDDSNYTNYLHVDTHWNTLTTGSQYTEYFTWADDAYGTAMRFNSSAGWEGPVWRKGIELDFETDTFKVKMKGAAVKNKAMSVYLWIFTPGADGGGRQELLMTIDYENAVDLGSGWFDYTLKINKKVSVFHGFEFQVVSDPYFIDDLRAVDTSK